MQTYLDPGTSVVEGFSLRTYDASDSDIPYRDFDFGKFDQKGSNWDILSSDGYDDNDLVGYRIHKNDEE